MGMSFSLALIHALETGNELFKNKPAQVAEKSKSMGDLPVGEASELELEPMLSKGSPAPHLRKRAKGTCADGAAPAPPDPPMLSAGGMRRVASSPNCCRVRKPAAQRGVVAGTGSTTPRRVEAEAGTTADADTAAEPATASSSWNFFS